MAHKIQRSDLPSAKSLDVRPQSATVDLETPVTPSLISSIRADTASSKVQSSPIPSFGSTSSKSFNSVPAITSQTHLPGPPTTPRHSNQEISLTLQNSNGTWDLETRYAASSYLRKLDLAAFFAFFSQRSGVPLADLDYLTFKLMFGDLREHLPQIETINKHSGEQEWEKLKSKIGKFFKFVRSWSPRGSEFDIWVEIGDKKEVLQEENEDLTGF